MRNFSIFIIGLITVIFLGFYFVVPVNAAVTKSGVSVSFNLSPWLFSGVYGGALWVSPPVLGPTTQGKNIFVIDVKANILNSKGVDVKDFKWSSSNSKMVTIKPKNGKQVKITIKQAGEAVVTVTLKDLTRKFVIKAWYNKTASSTLMVQISQK